MGWVIVAGQGTHSIKVDTGYGPGLITVRAGNMCGYSDEITLAINTSLASQVTLSPFTKAVCSGNSNYVLTGGAPAGGTYAGKGVVNGVFNAVLAGPGYHTITYSLINNCFGSAARQIYVGTCLGVKESILSLATEVYPNPASQQITVTVPFIGINTVTVKLVNSQGKEMFTQYYKSYKGSFKETLSVSGLAKGLYLFHVNTNSEVIVKRVLVH
ncbi:hypothetical protein TH61_17570 [Rufibacter sp. DG15C]|nr:hypothetical protein TH61_17570 [Rufibacter sp. DG15C]